MAGNRAFNFGPVALTTTPTTNILNPGAGARATPPVGYTDQQAYILITQLNIVNKTALPASFSLWRGATGANAVGTEVVGVGISVAANTTYQWNGKLRFDSADFLVGGSNTATALTIQGSGEIGVSG